MNTFTHTVLVIGLGWVASFVTVDGQNGIEPLNPALPAGGTADISRGPDGKPAQVVLSNMQRPVLDDMAVDMLAEAMTHHLLPPDAGPVNQLDPTFAGLANGYAEMGSYVRTQGPPSQNVENGYVRSTYAARNNHNSVAYDLSRQILAAPGKLKPSEVLGMALDVCDGDLTLANLTIHNLLKEAKYQSIPSEVSQTPTFEGRSGEYYSTGKDGNRHLMLASFNTKELMAHLADLRPAGDFYASDKMGPWYHSFGLFFSGSAIHSDAAQAGAAYENFLRYFNLGSTQDPVKMEANRWAADHAQAFNLLRKWQSSAWLSKHRGFYVPKDLTHLTPDELTQLKEDMEAATRFLTKGGHPESLLKAVLKHLERVNKLLNAGFEVLYCSDIRDSAGAQRSRLGLCIVYDSKHGLLGFGNGLSVPRPAPPASPPVAPTSGTPVLPLDSLNETPRANPTVADSTSDDLSLHMLSPLKIATDGTFRTTLEAGEHTYGQVKGPLIIQGRAAPGSIRMQVTYPAQPRPSLSTLPAGAATLTFDAPKPPAPPTPTTPRPDVIILYPPGM